MACYEQVQGKLGSGHFSPQALVRPLPQESVPFAYTLLGPAQAPRGLFASADTLSKGSLPALVHGTYDTLTVSHLSSPYTKGF